MKLDVKSVKKTGGTIGGIVAGAVVSRIMAGFIPVKNETIKRVAMTVVPLAVASMVKNDFARNIAIGASATQAGYLIKTLAGDKVKNETVQKALGTPEQPIIIYADDLDDEEFIERDAFLALPEYEDAFVSA